MSLKRRAPEPAKLYWAIGIAASIALHASGVAGAILLIDEQVRGAAPTEITFSDEASPVATPVPARAESAAKSEAAPPADRERLAPASTETVASAAAETLQALATDAASTPQPLQPEVMANLSPETVQPAVSPEAANATTPEKAADASTPEKAADASAPEKAEAIAESQAIAAPASAERLPSSAPADTASPAAETAERIAASAGLERLPSSKPTDTASPSAETAEKIAALEQPAGVGPLPAAPVAQDPQLPLPLSPPLEAYAPDELLSPLSPSQPSGRPADGLASERVQPATSSSNSPTEAGAVLSVQPETASPFKPSDTAAAFESLQPLARPQGAGAETATALATQPESVTSVARPAETVTGLEAEGRAPGVRPIASEAAPANVLPSQPEAAQPVERPVETALLVPARPGSILGTEVDKPSDRYRRIVDFIRQYSAGDCFIALPAMNLDGDVTFQTFGRDKAREEQFREALSGLDDLRAEISTGDVADPQCLALSFARSAKRYPGFSLMIDLDEAEIASGTRLSGSVLNADGRELHLLLVDDEGQVQSIDRFLTAGDGTDRTFETPLSLTGGPVVTKQILLAISTDPSLPMLAEPVNEPANAFFDKLAREIAETGADIDLAVEGFSVR